MTKCHFGLYGGSGTLQKFDALCVLGMNIINEKVITIFNTQLHIIVISINNIIASIQSFQIYKRKRQNEKRDLVQSRFMLFSGSGSCSWLSLLVSPLSSGLNCVQLCAILERSHPVQDCPSVRALCAEVGRLQHEDNYGQV